MAGRGQPPRRARGPGRRRPRAPGGHRPSRGDSSDRNSAAGIVGAPGSRNSSYPGIAPRDHLARESRVLDDVREAGHRRRQPVEHGEERDGLGGAHEVHRDTDAVPLEAEERCSPRNSFSETITTGGRARSTSDATRRAGNRRWRRGARATGTRPGRDGQRAGSTRRAARTGTSRRTGAPPAARLCALRGRGSPVPRTRVVVAPRAAPGSAPGSRREAPVVRREGRGRRGPGGIWPS